MLREEILAAKTPAARERRARRALLPAGEAPARAVEGCGPSPARSRVRILGRRLPGRTCGPYTRCRAWASRRRSAATRRRRVPADARAGALGDDNRGPRARTACRRSAAPAVNGPPRERFLYLTWIGRKGRAAPAMFRRAKLRLDAVPPEVLAKSLRSGLLVGRLELTAATGCRSAPRCALQGSSGAAKAECSPRSGLGKCREDGARGFVGDGGGGATASRAGASPPRCMDSMAAS